MSNDDCYDSNKVKVLNIIRCYQILLACISIVLTGSVIFILIYSRILLKGRRFLHYIFCIAISDFINSIGYSFGYPTSNFMCSLQGSIVVVFSRFSWFYTIVLVLNTHHLVYFSKYINTKTTRYEHLIIVTINILLFILPFTNGCFYGIRGVCLAGFEICTFGESNGHGALAYQWNDKVFFPFALVSLILILILTISMVIQSYRKERRLIEVKQFDEAHKTVFLYVLAMFIAWIPNVLYNSYGYIYADQNGGNVYPPNFLAVVNVLIANNSYYGIILSIIFWIKVGIARDEAYYLYLAIKSRIIGEDLLTPLIDDSRNSSIEAGTVPKRTSLNIA